jgi:hypothetical protein
MSTPKEATELPDWFDPERHSLGTGGIFETATNTLLGPDGQPLSEAVKLARAAAAAIVAEPAEAEPATEVASAPAPAPETRKRRGTGEIVAEAVAAAAEPKE